MAGGVGVGLDLSPVVETCSGSIALSLGNFTSWTLWRSFNPALGSTGFPMLHLQSLMLALLCNLVMLGLNLSLYAMVLRPDVLGVIILFLGLVGVTGSVD